MFRGLLFVGCGLLFLGAASAGSYFPIESQISIKVLPSSFSLPTGYAFGDVACTFPDSQGNLYFYTTVKLVNQQWLAAMVIKKGEKNVYTLGTYFVAGELETVDFKTCASDGTHVFLLNADLSGLVATLRYSDSLDASEQPFFPASAGGKYTARFEKPPGWIDAHQVLTGYSLGTRFVTDVNPTTEARIFVGDATRLVETEGKFAWTDGADEPAIRQISLQNNGGKVPIPSCALTAYNGSHLSLLAVRGQDNAMVPNVVLNAMSEIAVNNRVDQTGAHVLVKDFKYGLEQCPSVFVRLISNKLVMFGETVSGSNTVSSLTLTETPLREEYDMSEFQRYNALLITSVSYDNYSIITTKSENTNRKIIIATFPLYQPNDMALVGVWIAVGIVCVAIIVAAVVHILLHIGVIGKNRVRHEPLVTAEEQPQREEVAPQQPTEDISPTSQPYTAYDPKFEMTMLEPVDY